MSEGHTEPPVDENGYQPWPGRSVCWEEANDPAESNEMLFELALADVERERDEDEPETSGALTTLLMRRDIAIRERAFELLRSESAVERTLGCRILREWPTGHDGVRPHTERAVAALSELAEVESDEETLNWVLTAIGWQHHESGSDYLLRWKDDPRDFVRYRVAAYVWTAFPEGVVIPDRVAAVMLDFAADPDVDIRWSVFYDVAEYPAMFGGGRWRDAFSGAAQAAAASDPDQEVREQAARASEALRER